MIEITKPGYAMVQCDAPLPCPFCGGTPELEQVAHVVRWERIGRSRKQKQVRYALIASTDTLVADTFWFVCRTCGCTTGPHEATAQRAVTHWNKRT